MSAPIAQWVHEPLPSDVIASVQRLASVAAVARIAVMPDAHLARDVCIGTVVATRGGILPAAVGGDIGCGMAAVAFDADASLIADEVPAARLLSALHAEVPSIKHRRAQVLPADLDPSGLSCTTLARRASRDGRVQLGTLGRGNHFLEFQADETERLWLMVHSGSRGMGVAIRDHHLRPIGGVSQSGLPSIAAQSGEGRAYLRDHDWALRYADANRKAMVERVAAIVRRLFGVSCDGESLLACHHNHVRLERHFDEMWFVHRKGAISADLDEPGIIPGSMGTASYHTAGRGLAAALRSSSHGAGRRMSRTEARRRIGVRSLRKQMGGIWYDHRRERALLDEAPAAYRDIGDVMRAQRPLTRVVRRLRPLLSYKGT